MAPAFLFVPWRRAPGHLAGRAPFFPLTFPSFAMFFCLLQTGTWRFGVSLVKYTKYL
jgi:hypothetical protein